MPARLVSLRGGSGQKLWNLTGRWLYQKSDSCCNKRIARATYYCAVSIASPRIALTRLSKIGWTSGSGVLRNQFKTSASKYCYYSTMTDTTYIPSQLSIVTDLKNSDDYDGIVLISGTKPGEQEPEPFKSALSSYSQIHNGLFEDGAVLPIDLPPKRLIYSPTGTFDANYNDVRVYSEAAVKGMKRALKAGVKRPLLVLLPDSRFEHVELVTLLGALEALYVPLEVREISENHTHKAKSLGVYSPCKNVEGLVKLATALESGRYVARDIGGSDPERMAPIKIEEYIRKLFQNTNIKVEVISDLPKLEKEYPLFAAVNRAASVIPRHAGRIVFLTYEPTNVQETVMIVGKGVTMDTGGLDIKTGGNMVSMSRDKCGAASATGFMQTVNMLQPPHTKVVVGLGLVRNSCGENAYVADEIITARCGARVRIGNTDAEGRLVMADILYHMKEMALTATNPHLLTIATLTGHAHTSAGTGYSIAIDNSVARLISNAYTIQKCGESLADPFEVSILRREDFKKHTEDKFEGDDIQQNPKKGGRPERGHQRGGAFLVLASGLNKHDATSKQPIKYTHLDIAGSVRDVPKTVNAVTICALVKRFLGKLFDENLSKKM